MLFVTLELWIAPKLQIYNAFDANLRYKVVIKQSIGHRRDPEEQQTCCRQQEGPQIGLLGWFRDGSMEGNQSCVLAGSAVRPDISPLVELPQLSHTRIARFPSLPSSHLDRLEAHRRRSRSHVVGRGSMLCQQKPQHGELGLLDGVPFRRFVET